MASTYSPNLRIELIGNGEQSNTWGTTTNTNLGTLIEQAISGLVSVDVTAGNVTLTSLNGASDQSRQMIIVATGTPGVTRTITAPAVNKVYIVYNNSNAALSFIASGGTGVSLSVGAKKLIYCDGTNFVEAINSVAITSGSIDGVAIGATTASTGKFTNLEYTGTLTGSTGVINIGSNQIYKDASGNIGIGVASLTGISLLLQKSLTGSTDAAQFYNSPTILSGVTSTASLFVTSPSTQAAAFALGSLTHYNTSFNTKGAGSSITNQYGFSAESSLTTATNNYAFTGNLASATGRYNLYMAGTADNYIAGSLGIGATTIAGINVLVQKSLTGSTDAAQIYNNPTILSGVTSTTSLFVTAPSTQAASFALGALTHYNTSFNTKGAGSSITNQYGFSAASSLTTATNNYAFTGNLASATGRYNLYMGGTADNYIAGNLGVGVVPSGTYKLEVAGAISGTSLAITSAYPTVQPTLNLDFANSRLLDPRITFVRNSTATYYDGQTTALAEQNLLLQSQTFATTWVTSNTTLGSLTTAPDGTTTAYPLTASAVNGTLLQTFTATANAYTFSIYIQRVTGTGNIDITVDGTTYATQTTSGTWTRFNITTTPSAGSKTAGIRLAVSGDVVNIWGAQLEQRSSVTAYTPTTTSAITNYIPQLMTAPANVARFDCDPITRNSLGLLIEESRVNLLTYSGSVGVTNWYLYFALVNLNTIISPDGTLTGTKLFSNTTSNFHVVYSSTITFTATSYTISCYAKKAELNFIYIREALTSGSTAVNSFFNLSTGALGTIASGRTGTITSVGNGWYRCSITATAVVSTTTINFGCSVSDNTPSYTGDGYSGIYIWGAQLEAGAFATSYIPTVASTVTRATDQASMTGTNFSSWYNQAQGAFCAYADTIATNPTAFSMVMEGKDTANGLCVGQLGVGASSSTANTTVYGAIGGSNQSIPCTWGPSITNKLAISYNNISLAVNSVNGVNSTLTAFSGLNVPASIFIGSRGISGGSLYLNGHIRKLSYYPVALSSSNLVALTS